MKDFFKKYVVDFGTPVPDVNQKDCKIQPVVESVNVIQSSDITNSDIIEKLTEKVFSTSTPFTKVLAASNKLEKVISDPSQRIKVAVSLDDSITEKSIEDSMSVHTELLKEELKNFNHDLNLAREQRITKKARDRTFIQDSIKEHQKEIDRLVQEIQKSNIELEYLEPLIVSATNELNQVRSEFESSLKQVIQNITQQKDLIISSLKG